VTAHQAYPVTTCSPNSGDRVRNGGHDVAGSHGPVHLRHPERVLPVRSWSSATRPTQMTPYVSCSRTPSETVLTAFGVTSLTFLMAMYALERRGVASTFWDSHSDADTRRGTGSSQGLGRSGSSRLSGRSSHSDDSA
jgi:hypothetical protein